MAVTSMPRQRRTVAGIVAAITVGTLVGSALLLVPGASKEQHRAGVATTRPATPPLQDVTFTQRQRTAKALPGVEAGVMLGIGDVTAGKVKISVTNAEGESLVQAMSVKKGDVVPVPLGDRNLLLTVKDMRNALVGEDTVVFVLREEGATRVMTEEEKIERLIASVKELKGSVFIRNGTEHSAADAVEHMRRKWERGKKQITTAREFIDKAGSKSSISGEAYRIRYADGREVTAGEFLRKQLEQIEREPTTGPAAADRTGS